MAGNPARSRSGSGASHYGMGDDEGSVLGTGLTSRQLEAFGRKVTTTASHLMSTTTDPTVSAHYQAAMSGIQRELRRPGAQRRMFAFAQTTPTELVRSKFSTSEIQYRALSSLPDDLLQHLPEDTSTYSLFQGFQASIHDADNEHRKSHRRRSSHGQKRLEDVDRNTGALPPTIGHLKRERDSLNHRLEMMGVRKNMCSAEIHEIDNKIMNLNKMRKIVLDRLAGLEMDEADLEHELVQLDNRLEDMEDALDESVAAATTATPKTGDIPSSPIGDGEGDSSFMSESIYEKIPSPKAWRHKTSKKRSTPVLHEHFEPGSLIRELQAHNDMIAALDFDVPFGTMVSAALDDTMRVWDLNLGRCMGFLEGHHASVRCLQVEDSIVATGSMDASIRLWDLSRAKYEPRDHRANRDDEDDEDALGFEDPAAAPPTPPPSSMDECPLFSLEAHVDEVTALHLRGDTLISGSADKTLRQWDLVKGRCVQTLDVLWAAAQASSTMAAGDSAAWRPTGRLPDASADFVGALQCFDAALACGTADGMVRLWDLRSGQVHRSLVGHTGPVTCLQFDDVHLVTGSMDRSIRIWDLRTGTIHDAYAYDRPVTSMMFDTRRIVAAAGEDVVKVYDKTDGRHWDCGSGVASEDDGRAHSIVERVRIKDGYLTEGRKDGTIGIWKC
ncbi:mitochondrial division protein 1 [Trichophyton soudanense CBS 452.61]|uniref:Mitochondrial division protein 1 n=1 Tax=Trichophyton soudanense CBS 452.61 TaxID=1215331 RepID=A0A022XDU5_TRISD|nr:mitochondrial division protein 1 [Trichophyton soudanense CBS 452.61]